MPLGKISSASFGRGGYQNAMFGLSLHFDTNEGSIGYFNGTWIDDPHESASWTKEDQEKIFLSSTL